VLLSSFFSLPTSARRGTSCTPTTTCTRLNTISAFVTEKIGALTDLPGSPYLTGGRGGGGGFIASNRIVRVGNYFYASNSNTNNVSGFFIDAELGMLEPVPGSPFPTGGSSGSGFSLAVTPDGRFLYAARVGDPTHLCNYCNTASPDTQRANRFSGKRYTGVQPKRFNRPGSIGAVN